MRELTYPLRADWRDENGGRHRKSFPTEREAREFERDMRRVARLAKLSRQLGLRIRSTAGNHRRGEIRRLVKECSQIAAAVAIGKKSPASITLGGLTTEGRIAL